MASNLKVKIGIEIDTANAKKQLDSIIRELEAKKIKIKLDVDMASIKTLQQTFNQLSRDMSNLKIGNTATSSVKQMTSEVKTTNSALKESQTIYTNLNKLQNEEFSIRKKLVTANGEYKTTLENQLSTVMEQQSAVRQQAESTQNLGKNSQQLLKIDQQRVQKIRELSQAQEKYNQSMTNLKNSAIEDLNTKGLSTKQVDEYKRKLQSIDEVSMAHVQSEIKRINKEMENARMSTQRLADQYQSVGQVASTMGTALIKAFTLPAIGLGASVVTLGQFSSEMSTVKAVSGATTSEMEQLTAMAKQMGIDTAFSAKESASALKYMGMAGWTATEMVSGLPAIINLASASGEDLAMVSDIVTKQHWSVA